MVGCLSDTFVFLGTDASERWERQAFEKYARERFSKGNSWTYKKIQRNVTKVVDGFFVFDEELENQYLGTCRSTGSIIFDGKSLKLAQYSLSVPIPNDIILGFVEQIKSYQVTNKPQVKEIKQEEVKIGHPEKVLFSDNNRFFYQDTKLTVFIINATNDEG